MNKIRTTMMLALAMAACVLLLTACGGNGATADAPAPVAPTTPAVTPAPTPTPDVAAPVEEVEEGAQFAEEMYIITDGTAMAVINPFSPATSTTASRWLFVMIYDRLVYNLGDGNYGPALALTWETDDFQTITMTLRDEVYFHNGDRFTANDVVATVEAAQEGLGSQAHDIWRSVNTVTAIDPLTVEFVLHEVDVDFLFNISQPHGGILNSNGLAAGTEEGLWVGTGAFTIGSFSSNDAVTFVRNDDYWGEIPPTQRITMLTIPEPATRTIMMMGGEADISTTPPADDFPLIEASPDFVVFHFETNNPHYISFNMNAPIMSDLNFRRAVAHALYGPHIVMAAHGGRGWFPDSNLFGEHSEFRNPNIPAFPHDLVRAREYLEASDWNGEVIEIATAIPTNVRLAEMISLQLLEIGLVTTINVMDVAGFTAYATYHNNQSQMTVYVYPTTLSAAHMRNAFFPGSALNRASFNNPYVTELLERAAATVDTDERRALYMYAQEIVSAYTAYIPIFMDNPGMQVAVGVGGIRNRPDINHDFRYIFRVIE